ncbi:DUF309 domain-containing protein [Bacillus sp. FJAT-29790]|uniref:DUF309 domain-containing protein n=1 Tax=Bacillus sp. FJAT-29790 TaxID=1895002 RepID=UPI001C21C4F0|nr:DUF309 domain-containing protein [Bacillus sp. FJAT-29790]MBU8879180.1 DUF309 domain-containing protein [Bacillus sp. FJAT-29790]
MYPKEYIEYLVHFHGDRDYFECHEVLEEYWKSVSPKNKHSIWVGLILLAVSNYHHRRGNFGGAERTMQKSIDILNKNHQQLAELGLNAEKLFKELPSLLRDISLGANYLDYDMPIQDLSLITTCKEICNRRSLTWCKKSDLDNKEIVHRHSLRDRSPVIQERLKALNKHK